MDRFLTREEVIERLCWNAQLDAEQTKMAQSNKKDKKISFYQYSYDEMMKLYDNGEYKAARAASLHSLFILCDIDFLKLKQKPIEDLMHKQADEIVCLSNGKLCSGDVYSRLVIVANAVSKYSTEETIKQIKEQLNR